MNIDRMVLLSLVTGRKLVKNEDWGILMDAEELLLKDIANEWDRNHPTNSYDVYSPETRRLIKSYLIDKFPEVEYFCSLIEEDEDPKMAADYISKLSKSYTIDTIPVDYKVDNHKKK